MSQLVTWSFPTRVVFGARAVLEVGREAARLGAKRALIVTDKGVAAVGHVDRVEAALAEAGLTSAVFDGVLGNPVEANVHDGVRAYRESGADIVVAVGGGSPLDVGKLVRLGVNHHLPLAEYADVAGGAQRITAHVPPMLALPTTAGTGSEVGRSGVVTLAGTRRKTVISSPHLLASAAILDPELTRSMPPFVTATTGYDALAHCVEAFLAEGDHPMADGIAAEGIRLSAQHLERAVKNGNDLEARGGMMKAAMMGAVASEKGLGACRSMAQPLSSEHGLHHGFANALCLPAVVDFVREAIPERVARVSELLGASPDPMACAEALAGLCGRIGLTGGLGGAGVPRGGLDELARLAFEDACHRASARPVSRADLLALYQASFA